MKYLKMTALAIAAAAALVAFMGAGSASATVLCKVTEVPCSEENEWPLGTFGAGSMRAGTSGEMKSTSGAVVDTCTAVLISGTLESKGGAGETIKQKGTAENLKWEKCTTPMTTTKGGEVEIHHIAGTDNGTVIVKSFETTVKYLGVSCVYGYGTGVHVGVMTGGTEPFMHINAALNKTGGGFLCPGTIVGQAEGVLTEPASAGYILAS